MEAGGFFIGEFGYCSGKSVSQHFPAGRKGPQIGFYGLGRTQSLVAENVGVSWHRNRQLVENPEQGSYADEEADADGPHVPIAAGQARLVTVAVLMHPVVRGTIFRVTMWGVMIHFNLLSYSAAITP